MSKNKQGIVIEFTLHAIDRASERLLSHWSDSRKKNEGMGTWLIRMAYNALRQNGYRSGRITYQNIVFSIKGDGDKKKLKSVWESKAKSTSHRLPVKSREKLARKNDKHQNNKSIRDKMKVAV